jgi:hypothetical protein
MKSKDPIEKEETADYSLPSLSRSWISRIVAPGFRVTIPSSIATLNARLSTRFTVKLTVAGARPSIRDAPYV